MFDVGIDVFRLKPRMYAELDRSQIVKTAQEFTLSCADVSRARCMVLKANEMADVRCSWVSCQPRDAIVWLVNDLL